MRNKVNYGELKADTGTIDEAELSMLLEDFDIEVPKEIEFPFSVKLTVKHTLHIERRASQRLTENGLVNQLNWRIHENMTQPVQRINA